MRGFQRHGPRACRGRGCLGEPGGCQRTCQCAPARDPRRPYCVSMRACVASSTGRGAPVQPSPPPMSMAAGQLTTAPPAVPVGHAGVRSRPQGALQGPAKARTPPDRAMCRRGRRRRRRAAASPTDRPRRARSSVPLRLDTRCLGRCGRAPHVRRPPPPSAKRPARPRRPAATRPISRHPRRSDAVRPPIDASQRARSNGGVKVEHLPNANTRKRLEKRRWKSVSKTRQKNTY